VVQSEAFKQSMGELGMTVPLDNTPEQYDAYLRAETVLRLTPGAPKATLRASKGRVRPAKTIT
jgi:hypothetical protein